MAAMRRASSRSLKVDRKVMEDWAVGHHKRVPFPEGDEDGDAAATVTIDVVCQMKGHLWKMATSMRKRWARRFFVLKDGFMLYYSERKTPFISFDVHPKGVIPLGGCSVALFDGGPSKALTHSFIISHPSFHGRNLVLCAESLSEMERWMKAVQNCRLITFKNAMLGAQMIEQLKASEAALAQQLDASSELLEQLQRELRLEQAKSESIEGLVAKLMLEKRTLVASLQSMRRELDFMASEEWAAGAAPAPEGAPPAREWHSSDAVAVFDSDGEYENRNGGSEADGAHRHEVAAPVGVSGTSMRGGGSGYGDADDGVTARDESPFVTAAASFRGSLVAHVAAVRSTVPHSKAPHAAGPSSPRADHGEDTDIVREVFAAADAAETPLDPTPESVKRALRRSSLSIDSPDAAVVAATSAVGGRTGVVSPPPSEAPVVVAGVTVSDAAPAVTATADGVAPAVAPGGLDRASRVARVHAMGTKR